MGIRTNKSCYLLLLLYNGVGLGLGKQCRFCFFDGIWKLTAPDSWEFYTKTHVYVLLLSYDGVGQLFSLCSFGGICIVNVLYK